MSIGYTAVQWNRHKRIYDVLVTVGIVGYLGLFVVVSRALWSGDHAVSLPIIAMRALGSCAAVLLHVILCIGPLARLDPRFLPLLYNRRHLGVITFLVALAHATITVGYYHGFGVLNPLVSLLATNTNLLSLTAFPYQLLGLGTLAIMFLMAATSHDFWLKNLSPGAWKGLHMLVYPGYALLVGHVALGALQTDRAVIAPAAMGVGVALVVGLHFITGIREVRRDRAGYPEGAAGDDWIDAGTAGDIPVNRARVVCASSGERIAVFRHRDGISAVTDVCAHQGGPLGEGKIVDGCITCPWHGWQYKPGDGCSPAPIHREDRDPPGPSRRGAGSGQPGALPPGTPVEPAKPEEAADV